MALATSCMTLAAVAHSQAMWTDLPRKGRAVQIASRALMLFEPVVDALAQGVSQPPGSMPNCLDV